MFFQKTREKNSASEKLASDNLEFDNNLWGGGASVPYYPIVGEDTLSRITSDFYNLGNFDAIPRSVETADYWAGYRDRGLLKRYKETNKGAVPQYNSPYIERIRHWNSNRCHNLLHSHISGKIEAIDSAMLNSDRAIEGLLISKSYLTKQLESAETKLEYYKEADESKLDYYSPAEREDGIEVVRQRRISWCKREIISLQGQIQGINSEISVLDSNISKIYYARLKAKEIWERRCHAAVDFANMRVMRYLKAAKADYQYQQEPVIKFEDMNLLLPDPPIMKNWSPQKSLLEQG